MEGYNGLEQLLAQLEGLQGYGVKLDDAWAQNFPAQDDGMGALGVPRGPESPEETEAHKMAKAAFARNSFERYGHGPDAGTGYDPQPIPSVFRASDIGGMQARLGDSRRQQEWQRLQGPRVGALQEYVRGLLG